jgi:hypothetical protein
MPKESEQSSVPADTKRAHDIDADLKTLVRGPDGTLWLLSKEEAPRKVEGHEKKRVDGILTKTEKDLSDVFGFRDMGVHVGDEVFDGHQGQHCEIPQVSSD